MNNVARTHPTEKKSRAAANLVKRSGGSALSRANRVIALPEALNEAVEDELLNAIADERAAGPFVKVSLSDL